MKRNLKQAATVMLALAMLAALFTGCGDSKAASAAASTSAAAESVTVPEMPSETAAAIPEAGSDQESASDQEVNTPDELGASSINYPIADGATLTAWGSMNANLANYMESISENAVIKKAAEITGVTLDAASVSSDVVSEKFSLMIASGDYADLIDNVNSYYSSAQAAINDGILIDLSDYVETNAPDYYARLSSNADWLRQAYTDSGDMPMFATLTLNPTAVTSSGYLIRQDWLNDLGLEVPTTTEELHTVLTAFASEKGATSPLWLNSNGLGLIAEAYGVACTYEPMGGFYPYKIVDGEVVSGYRDESFKEYLTMMAQWYNEGLIWKDFSSDTFCFGINTSNACSLFLNGSMGVAYGETKDIKTLPEQSNDEGFAICAMPDPTPDGAPNHITAVDGGFGLKHGISTACADPELACKYINFFYTDEGIRLCSYGVEGEAFELDADGEPQYTDLIRDNPDGLSSDNAFEIYCLSDFSCMTDGMRKTKFYDENELAASDIWAASRDGAWTYPKGAALTAEESETFNGIFTDVNTYVAEMILGFITGGHDIDSEWDTFQSTLTDMGVDEALQIKTDAYQRYMSK